ncbi:MAG: hypothetical protein ACK4UN_11295 [Limisphaerales bacterium]
MPKGIRYISYAILLVLAFYAVLEGGLSSLPRIVLFCALVAVSIGLAMAVFVDLFTVVFVYSAKRCGRFIGRLVAIVRQESRK